MTARIPQPLPNVLRDVWAPIKWDNANFMDHLLEDSHISRALQNHEIVIVAAGKFGRTAAQTTLGQIAVLPGVGRATSPPGLRPSGLSLLRFRREGRNSAIGCVDDQRRASARYDRGSAVVPEI